MNFQRTYCAILLLLSIGLANAETNNPAIILADDICSAGYEIVRTGDIEKGVAILSICVASNEVSPENRRRAYIERAWSYKILGKMNEAVGDQEAAFKLAPAAYSELINYALYLRYAGRVAESLTPLKEAATMDEAKGQTSMMTQYQLGWTYQELGKHREAVAAFTKGIPQQTDFAFAYYKRGLSFEALGQKEAARSDFQQVKTLIATDNRGTVTNKELPYIRKKLAEYGIELKGPSLN
jgi:tetratricopeptide (TPR) repeat protein